MQDDKNEFNNRHKTTIRKEEGRGALQRKTDVGTDEYRIICSCGWVEKARGLGESGERAKFHRHFPHKTS